MLNELEIPKTEEETVSQNIVERARQALPIAKQFGDSVVRDLAQAVIDFAESLDFYADQKSWELLWDEGNPPTYIICDLHEGVGNAPGDKARAALAKWGVK